MALLINDTFTDTSGVAVENHTSDSGATWMQGTRSGLTGQAIITSSGTARPATANTVCFYTTSEQPSSGNYSVTGKVSLKTNRTSDQFGIAARYFPTQDVGYVAFGFGNSGYILGYRAGGSFNQFGSSSYGTMADGDIVTVAIISVPSSSNSIVALIVNGNALQIVVDATIPQTGQPAFELYAGSTPGDSVGAQLDTFTTNSITVATAYTITGPSTITANSPATYTITPNGTYYGTVTLIPNGAGLSTAQTLTFGVSAVSQNIIFTPTTTGQLAITCTNVASGGLSSMTDPSSATTTVLLASSSSSSSNSSSSSSSSSRSNSSSSSSSNSGSNVTIASTNSLWISSPGNWVQESAELVSTDFGAKRTIAFTGSSSATLTFDLSVLTGTNTSQASYPQIRVWLYDGTHLTPSIDYTIAASLIVAQGLSSETRYELSYEFVRGDYTLDAYAPLMAIRETGIILDPGASGSTPTNLPSDRMVIAGDSIIAGLAQNAISGVASCDGGTTLGKAIGTALNAQLGQIGKGGVGWAYPGNGNVPAFTTSWKYCYSGFGRNFGTLKRFVVVLGTNDGLNNISDLTVSSAVQSWLSDARSTLGVSCWIHVCVPVGGFKRAAINTGVSAYLVANPTDTKIGIPDLGLAFQIGLSSTIGTGTLYAPYDGIHLSPIYHGRAGAAFAAKIEAIETSSTIILGPGLTATTLTIYKPDAISPLANFECWITSDSAGVNPITGVATTNSNGQVTFNLNSGTTYYLRGHGNNFQIGGTVSVPVVAFVA